LFVLILEKLLTPYLKIAPSLFVCVIFHLFLLTLLKKIAYWRKGTSSLLQRLQNTKKPPGVPKSLIESGLIPSFGRSCQLSLNNKFFYLTSREKVVMENGK